MPFPADEPLSAECRHFAECVENRSESLTPGEDGIQVLEVLEACQRSLSLNGQPVRCNSHDAAGSYDLKDTDRIISFMSPRT